jgi:hypothetical protein
MERRFCGVAEAEDGDQLRLRLFVFVVRAPLPGAGITPGLVH